MSISLRGLHPQVRERAELVLFWANHFKIPTTVTSTFRSFEEQDRLRKRFLAGNAPFPANRPGDSSHNFGFAWDAHVNPRDQEDFDFLRRWAGFEVLENDIIHAQVPGWRRFKNLPR